MWAPFPRLFPLDCSFAHESWLKFCGRIIISFDARCFSRRASTFERATKRPFSTPARHANGTFLGDFFLLSLLYSRALCSLFFRHTRSKLEYKKRFCDDAMRTQRALLYRENKKRFSLSLSLLEESVFSHCSFCSFFLVSSSSLVVVVFYESVMIRKKTNWIFFLLFFT